VEGTKPHKRIVSLHQIETSLLKEKHVSKKERKGKKKGQQRQAKMLIA